MTLLLFPPECKVLPSGPVIFLAGPIQGAPDWQAEAAPLLLPHAHVANPKAPDWHGHTYAQQVDWETQHLTQAARWGVLLFWLAAEVEHFIDRAYAQTPRFELAEWVTRSRVSPHIKIVIGIEKGFTGERYIRHRLLNLPIPICSDLTTTCLAAIEVLSPKGAP